MIAVAKNGRPSEHTRKVNGKVIPINVGVERRQKTFEESIARSKALHPSSQPQRKRIITDIREIEDMAAELEQEDLDFLLSNDGEDATIIRFPVERRASED